MVATAPWGWACTTQPPTVVAAASARIASSVFMVLTSILFHPGKVCRGEDGVSTTFGAGSLRPSGRPGGAQIAVLRDVALTVDAAHRQGVLYRDLKPDNILIDRKNQPHVDDFGL